MVDSLVTESGDSLAELETKMVNLRNSQMDGEITAAHHEMNYLKTRLQRVKRLCLLKSKGLLPAGTRAKRDVSHTPSLSSFYISVRVVV